MEQSKHTKQTAGRMGGLATFARHGPDHMRTIGKRGAATFWKRYTMQPAGLSDFAIVKRKTNEVVAFTSGRPDQWR
jgi:general stress protein YciG